MFRTLLSTVFAILIFTSFKAAVPMSKEVIWPKFSREAHRGGRGLAPENTIPAMIKALDMNITTLEMDCQITADRKVIVSHDAKINPQFTLNKSGEVISSGQEEKLVFYRMSYEEIRKFDVGAKTNQKFPRQEKVKTSIPLLSDLIDSVQRNIKLHKRNQVFYNIETKISPEGDNKLHPAPDEFVKLLMDVIKRKGIEQWVIIQSFDPRTLEIIHKYYPRIKTSFLIASGNLNKNLSRLSFKPDVYSPLFTLLNSEQISDCHVKGIRVIPWTVNEKDKITELTRLGVDGIITDYPDLF